MPSDSERITLRLSFDQAAELYQKARPDYPDELYDTLINIANLRRGDRLLEVGCATGKATLPLAKRGFSMTCVELGSALAAAARRNLVGMNVDVIEGNFEDWEPETLKCFDLVFAATAWQWIDPKVKYSKAWQVLRPGGHLAFWDATHVFPDNEDPFFRDIQDVYAKLGEGKPSDSNDYPRPGQLQEQRDEIESSGLFEIVDIQHFDWESIYHVEEYIDLLNTFSGHILMDDSKRDVLYNEIRVRLNKRADKSVRRHWGVVLHVARRRD